MKKLLLLLVSASLLLVSCDDYGKKVAFGKSEVYYKGKGVTEDDAKNVGDFLLKSELFNKDRETSAQVTKDDDTYVVHLVMDAKKIDESVRLNLWKLQYALSKDVFDGQSARFAFADDKLKDLEVLNPVNRLKVGAGNVYYDNSEFKKSEAQKLADFLKEKQYLGEGKEADVYLTKEEEAPVVRFVVNKDMVDQNKETLLPVFSYWQSQIQEDVLNDKKAKVVLTTTAYEDFKKVPKLTAEEKQQFENQTNTQQDNSNTQTQSLDSLSTQTSSGVIRLPNQ